MHGRLKVKTTAEQQEEKRKEREKKSLAFTQGMKMVFKNRGNPESRQLVLDTSEKLLSGNPDVYTLWNVRKEKFLEMRKEKDQIDDVFHKELQFLQSCLLVNPKSYGVWNQRHFVMLNMTNPDWHEELRLCNKFLEYDERNFHCWDYRRFVVKHANISPEEEFDFTTKKIIENFSNYSAWHNRSKLLPLVKPDPSKTQRFSNEALIKEMELAQNAFFTDPNDQSAWIYQRWLLGRQIQTPCLLSLVIKRSPCPVMTATFSLPISQPSSIITINNEICNCEWKSGGHDDKYEINHNFIWKLEIPSHKAESDISADISVEVSFPDLKSCPEELKLDLVKDQSSNSLVWTKDNLSSDNSNIICSGESTEVDKLILEGELESCKMLLDEEPDNKWTMLTIVYLMHAIDCFEFTNEIEELISKLIKVDPKRSGYYRDLRSKYTIERELKKLYEEKNNLNEVDLSGKELSSVLCAQYLSCCKRINFSNNNLTDFSFCRLLTDVEYIDLRNNQLTEDSLDKINSMFSRQISISV